MADQIEEKTPPAKHHDERGESGQFIPKTEPKPSDQSQPKLTDYVKMNSILAIQLGLTDKLADLQSRHTPTELFAQLSFMADNLPSKTTEKLPPNQPIAATSSQGDDKKVKIDNFTLREEMDSKTGGFHGDISIIDIIKNKKRK